MYRELLGSICATRILVINSPVFEVAILLEGNKEAISRRYLLGDLAEEDAARLEDDYFVDDSAFEAVQVAEDEIIDAYVRNELSAEERKQFQENLLTSTRISQRVEFAKLLAARASGRRAQERVDTPVVQNVSWWKTGFQPSLALRGLVFACVIVISIGSIGLVVDWFRVRDESKRLAASRAELERQNLELIADNKKRALEAQQLAEALRVKEAENAKLNEQIEQHLNKPSSTSPLISILLSISGSRAGGTNQTVKLPEQPAILELKIPLEEVKFRRYSVTVKKTDERVVSGPHELKADGKLLRLRLATTRLVPDDYIVTVSGIDAFGKTEEIEDYTFRIRR